MSTYLFKTEPSTYSFEDLRREGSCVWDGVSNNTALMHLRTIAAGDEVLIYHTGDEKAIVGLARATGPATQDPKNPGHTARGEIKTPVVRLVPVRRAATPVSLAQIKGDARFKGFSLVTQARLSVMPVPGALDRILRALAGLA